MKNLLETVGLIILSMGGAGAIIMIELTTTQFWNYQQRFKDYLDGKISLAERVTDSDKQSFETIEKNVEALNNELREHLQKIYIVT